ncbi:MAG: hypothetical protein M5U01_07220 [Ardenticatenaceae bacterium]|nr:hypothetical protein [Ardenticatenaceae bacterium]
MIPTIVVVSPHSEACAVLVNALKDRGCQCQGVGLTPVDVARVGYYHPVAVVMDSLITPHAMGALEASLVALSPRPPVITLGQANWVPGEFDPAVEEQLVEQLADVVPALRRFRRVLHAAADIIEAETREVVARWIQRLSLIPAFAAQPEMSLEALCGEVAAFIKAVVDVLRYGRESPVWSRDGIAYAGAVAHARLRIGQGIPMLAVVQECEALQLELGMTFWRSLVLQPFTAAEVCAIRECFQSAIDGILLATVEEYRRLKS